MDDHSLTEIPINVVTSEDRPLLLEHSQWLTIKNLLLFSVLADISDIPRDLLEDVISILHISARLLFERPKDAHDWLHALGTSPPKVNASGLPDIITLFSLVDRAARCLLREDVDRPDSAFEVLQFMIAMLGVLEEVKEIRTVLLDKSKSLIWFLKGVYVDALVLSGRFEANTMKILDHILESAGTGSELGIKVQMHLILCYQQMGIEVDKKKRHTENVVQYLRNGPYLRDHFATFMNRQNRPVHPVATVLGSDWFTASEKRFRHLEWKQGSKRRPGFCENCRAFSTDIKLLRCAQCQRTQYCSKACQKANWKAHREDCLELANTRKIIPQFGNTWIGDVESQRQTDIEKWHYSNHYPCLHGPMHALGLQRDPQRGWTHFMVAEMDYPPDSVDDYRRHFRVVRCGVLLMKPEVTKRLEVIVGKEVGWMAQFVRYHCEHTLLVESDVPLAYRVPMFYMFYGLWFTPIVRCSIVSSGHVNGLGYDPHWHKSMNCATAESGSPPPGPLRLPGRRRAGLLVDLAITAIETSP
ncbi:hypothetical protein EUX98_g4752 [Antrodiella citrinella]|uniref:MYND-type domain-containing protein n=1 Tax=Antrodiella citrinella TaxID=2447956 RepID=A0A4S4MT72_9APHY|nr:hypothetical protein EUX98_g4752 [Antrodiella citrinella]